MFPAYLQISPYLQIYRSVSPDLQICIVTLYHTYTRRGNPTPTLEKFATGSLGPATHAAPKVAACCVIQHTTISSIYSTYTLAQHPNYKINNYATSIVEDRTRSREPHRPGPCAVPVRLADVAVRSPETSQSTMAGDSPHTQ
jgi:hypothetical protein